MKKQILLIFFFYLGITSMLHAQIVITVNSLQGGYLSTAIAAELYKEFGQNYNLTSVTKLTITGTIDATDFVTMRDKATALTEIDLSGVNITAYTGKMGTAGTNSTSYSANTIPDYAFNGCSRLTSIIIPSSVTSIGQIAFQNCTGLTSITIPSSVTSIGQIAFQNCTGLTSITIQSSITSIDDYAFRDCKRLTSITIPSSVTSIGANAFEDCTGLTSIAIPSSVTSIGDAAFSGCFSLSSITIPSSVTFIGTSAFSDMGLTSIYVYAAIPIDLSLSQDVFYTVNKVICTLYVPAGSKSAYKAAQQWEDFTNIVEMTTAIPTITNSTISLYPNPTTESFQISGFEGLATMTISDLNGKTILSKQVTSNESISVGTLSKGLYILKVITNEGTIERKVVRK